ncbi:MAG: glycosyltransferase family 2 protein [Planctomycetes bacterium]|nr:glycosyltransferase family 2 protein [Planctomycetota bacterium]
MPGAPSVSLILPTLDAGPFLEEVLAAIDLQDAGVELERLAIDSGSRDGTRERLVRHGFTVHSIARKEFNHGATRDFAIAQTRGEFVVLLTQDAVAADPHWLRHLLEPYADPRVGGVYSRQIPRSGCNPIIAQRIRNWAASRPEPVVQQVESPEAFACLSPLERLERAAFDNVASSVRRSAWQEIPFGRRAFGEDLAWGKRALLAGWRIVFQPKSLVVHSHNRSVWDEFRRLYCDHQNLNELFGVTLVPTVRTALRALRPRTREHLRTLDSLPPEEARRWSSWARGYAFAELFGIYLGARSPRWRERRVFGFRALDRILRRGI